MPLARFKDLCIDAGDVDRIGRFWAAALGLRHEMRVDGTGRLTGHQDEQTIWVNAVPERRTVKQRVHLDVHARSVAELERLGATVADHPAGLPWTVMADPEGGELCAFERAHPPDYRLYEVVVDSVDARAIARWWGEVYGVAASSDDDGSWWLADVPGMPFECVVFGPVPEPKTVKNRIHWDVLTGSVDALVEHGATLLRRRGDGGIAGDVLADPEGNEFCAFTDG